VSGGANSVTKTIQATTIVLKGGDAEQKERITICDTPGFGDSKGHEQEISNGLGIIHALKGAASIKPVIVIDHRTMDGGRFAPLRKNLSTVIAMMGRDSIDFSPFSYIFTRCEGKSKKRVSQQLLFFQDAVRQDPHMKDRDILDALLTDMISKTKPGDAICIDPEVPDDASATLKRLWSGSRLNDPANRFVNFCSKESMAALFMQVNILIHDIERSLSASDLNSAAEQLNKMLGLAKALTLPEVDEAIEHGTSKAKKFVISLSSDIKNLVTHADVEFEQKLNDMSSKLYLLSQSGAIREICQMDFDYCSFVNDITGRIFAMTRKPISDINAIVSGSENVLQQSIKRYILVVNSFQDILDENKIETENSMMVKAADDLINPIIVVLGDALNRNDPKSSTLNEYLPKLNFVLAMNAFFRSSTFSALNSKISQCNLFETELKNIVDNISDMSENCVTHLVDLDKALHEEHLGEAEWSVSSILKFDDIAESKECRDFLQAVLTSDSLVTSIQNDSDLKSLIRDFDDAVRKYVPSLVLFLQDESQAVFDNETGNMTDRVNKAHTIINSVDFVFVIATTLKDLDSTLFQKALDELNDVKSRSKYFTDESKKASIHHTIRRGKTLQPTEEELARTHQKKDTRNLLRWYERCNELKVYWKKHGHCNVPRKDPRLGQVSRITVCCAVLFCVFDQIDIFAYLMFLASGCKFNDGIK
jgi:hypothetical protein